MWIGFEVSKVGAAWCAGDRGNFPSLTLCLRGRKRTGSCFDITSNGSDFVTWGNSLQKGDILDLCKKAFGFLFNGKTNRHEC
jgi:hypothetical protein